MTPGITLLFPRDKSTSNSSRRFVSAQRNTVSEAGSVTPGPAYGGWLRMGRWLVPLFVEPRLIGNLDVVSVWVADVLPRSSRHAIRAAGSVPCLK
jgi:hypothetical protein